MYSVLDIVPIYNVAYSPALNPIESVFSKVKAIFNNSRLNHLVNKTGFNASREIEEAFKTVSVQHCASCVRKSQHLLNKAC